MTIYSDYEKVNMGMDMVTVDRDVATRCLRSLEKVAIDWLGIGYGVGSYRLWEKVFHVDGLQPLIKETEMLETFRDIRALSEAVDGWWGYSHQLKWPPEGDDDGEEGWVFHTMGEWQELYNAYAYA